MVSSGQGLHRRDDPELEPRAVLRAVRDDKGTVRDFIYLEVNDLACRQHRRSREELQNRSVAQTVPEVERSGLLKAYADCVNSGQPLRLVDLTYRGTTPGAVEDTSTPQTPHNPLTRRYEVVVTPLPEDCISLRWREVTDSAEALEHTTDLRHTAELLAEAEEQRDAALAAQAEVDARYRRLIENSCVATALVDLQGRFRLVNPAMCELFGYRADALLSMSWTDICYPGDLGMGFAALADLLSGRIDTHCQQLPNFDPFSTCEC